jgi:1,4-dihydroxy-2-naphthoate octaprenyltransferase
MGRLQDKVAIITGAGTGIGRACAELFGEEGAKVVGVSRTQKNLDETLDLVKKRGGEGMVIAAAVTFLMAVLLIYTAFGSENLLPAVFFLLLGISAIIAAVKYTVGKSAYGYRGLGDLFVFIFFGLVAVYGSYFLYVHIFNWKVLLPAVAFGFLSAGVLNLNNIRDRVSDQKAGKNTLVVKLGERRAKTYHYFLIIGAVLCLLLFSALTASSLTELLYVLAFIPLLLHLKRVVENENPMLLDPELKVLALSTFFIAVLFGLGLLI